MRIGLDFDNTIVCYDAAIAVLAEKLLDLPAEVPRTKLGLRDHLRTTGREPEWTAFQGVLYGPGMVHAQPFAGAIDTMLQLVEQGHELVIISHRSRRPYAGEPHDLHAAARDWVTNHLQVSGLFELKDGCECLYFLRTKDDKIAKINELSCNVFLDDLPELLMAPGLPNTMTKIQFNPSDGIQKNIQKNHYLITHWAQLPKLVSIL